MYSFEYFQNQLQALVGFRFWMVCFTNTYKVAKGDKNQNQKNVFVDAFVLTWPTLIKYNLAYLIVLLLVFLSSKQVPSSSTIINFFTATSTKTCSREVTLNDWQQPNSPCLIRNLQITLFFLLLPTVAVALWRLVLLKEHCTAGSGNEENPVNTINY